MSYIYTFLTGFLIGGVVGILCYRNNVARLKATEDKGKSILDALKGR
jgi:hypothetical protein